MRCQSAGGPCHCRKRPIRNRKGQCHGQDSHDNAQGVHTAVNHRPRLMQQKSPGSVNSRVRIGSQRYGPHVTGRIRTPTLTKNALPFFDLHFLCFILVPFLLVLLFMVFLLILLFMLFLLILLFMLFLLFPRSSGQSWTLSVLPI
jgi:hypothetical protein